MREQQKGRVTREQRVQRRRPGVGAHHPACSCTALPSPHDTRAVPPCECSPCSAPSRVLKQVGSTTPQPTPAITAARLVHQACPNSSSRMGRKESPMMIK